MALETLENVDVIDGFTVRNTSKEKPLEGFIILDPSENKISFQIQDGPVAENGINGCQVDQLISTARLIITNLNNRFHSYENEMVLLKLTEALHWLNERKANRIKRGVEGHNLP
jgi:hypothetical protein